MCMLTYLFVKEELIDAPERARMASQNDDPLSNADQAWNSYFKVALFLESIYSASDIQPYGCAMPDNMADSQTCM